jgi:hypothetical protein
MGLKEMEMQTYNLPETKLEQMIEQALQEPQDKIKAEVLNLRSLAAMWGGGAALAASITLAVFLWPAEQKQAQRLFVAAEEADLLFDMAMLDVLDGV